MPEEEKRRLALGCITRFVESPDPFQEFIRNARDRGYDVEVLIIALTRTADLAVLSELNELVPIELIEVGEELDLPDELVAAGAHGSDVMRLLETEPLDDSGLFPFCTQRNSVLLKALHLGMDWLIFFDHNMRAQELIGDPSTQSGRAFRPVDVFGPHIEGLASGAAVTTGGYSGFDAFPPIQFASLRDLLHGVGREEAHSVVSAEGALSGLHLALDEQTAPKPTIQVFAGNLGLDLTRALSIPPFFSGWFQLGDDVVLARGEDTLLGAAAVNAQLGCIDIGTRVFLDPHDTYPKAPDLSSPRMKERLYWNCLGWIARLPLLDSLRHEAGLLDWSLDELQASRRLALAQGSDDLAETLRDTRFYNLPTFFDLVHMKLKRTIETYEKSKNAWERIVHAIRPEAK